MLLGYLAPFYKAAIWDVTKYDPLDAFEAYRKVADSAQVSKSVSDLYEEFILHLRAWLRMKKKEYVIFEKLNYRKAYR